MSSNNNFILRAECKGHIDQCRTVCANPLVDGGIITGSLDCTVKTFTPNPNYREEQANFENTMFDGEELIKAKKQSEYQCTITMVGHEKFITSVDFLSDHYAVSGSHDKSLIVWNLVDGSPVKRFTDAHSNAISCLTVDKYTGLIISGSWDKTAKCWNLGNDVPVYELKGHQQNVLCTLAVSNGLIITGSGDGSIKFWENGKNIRTIDAAHSSCVRSLKELPNIGFVSASNDGTVKTWTLHGDCIAQIQAHNTLVYSVELTPSGEMLTASEDKTVKVWNNGSLIQTIEHPGCVWQVVALPNGDIATACSDGVARVFTRKLEKAANPEIIQAFNDNIANSKIKKSGVDPTKLPTELVLNSTKGTSDGEIKLVNNNGIPEAYSWSAAQQKWERVGEVTEGPGVGDGFAQKTYHNGKMYDYVFDVELEHGSGLRNFKLPFNKGDNPYFAAQQFIWDNDLSQNYLDQIAKFIMDNTDIHEETPPQFMTGDPFTGHQRETFVAKRPGTQTKPKDTTPVSSPFAQEQQQYQKELEERERQKNVKHFPGNVKIFDQANYDGILRKLNEFNDAIKNSENSSLALTKEEAGSLSQLCSTLKAGQGEKVTTSHIVVVEKILQWPIDKIFPGVDLFRLLILTNPAANFYSEQYKNGSNILTKIVTLCFNPTTTYTALKMLAFRALANMFHTSQLKFIISKHAQIVVDNASKMVELDNANMRAAYSYFILNTSVSLYTNTQSDALKEKLLTLACQAIPNETDTNILYDLLVAVGTLLTGASESVKAVAKQQQQIFTQKTANPNAKIAACAFQIVSLLSQK
ncbi:hypothetical protein FDP41_008927 [Naegleria fowleri]|uniref:Uncharacterized protein n=1 Tax=Naegleria fowleri TaxID=5763 RepID=A0A6A5BFD1_NAEFO|nr:uncharacterized protein FDP41_008927 [Naegleria fowleri]KAF0972678.1 hypothetical protein FDP41_008927 [Naegleria fowleri]